MAATLIGATQMFGMAGGSAGQFVVGPVIAAGVPWSRFWIVMGGAGLVIGVLLYLFLPAEEKARPGGDWLRGALRAMATVFRNPQSILCGMIAGLLFIPTTIFDMIWGVRFLQEAHGYEYASAVIRSATVPLGWIIGCPLLGLRLRPPRSEKARDPGGRPRPPRLPRLDPLRPRERPAPVPPRASWPAWPRARRCCPYTVIKEANPPEVSGTATGVVNFLNFTFSALLGPVFGGILRAVSGGADSMTLEHYQTAFEPLLYGVGLADPPHPRPEGDRNGGAPGARCGSEPLAPPSPPGPCNRNLPGCYFPRAHPPVHLGLAGHP